MSPGSGDDHFLAQLGMRDIEVPGFDLSIEMDTGPRLVNTFGALQGGLIATLIDVAAGRAALLGLAPGLGITTSELGVHYLEPVLIGPARACVRTIRRGRRQVVLSVEVHDVGAGKLAAISTTTFVVVARRG